MLKDKKFCKGCGQKLPDGVLSKVMGSHTHEFEDGWYCEKCAIEKVEVKRRMLKK